MRKKYITLLTVLILPFMLLSCGTKKKDDISHDITKRWKFTQVVNMETGETSSLTQEDYLSLVDGDNPLFQLSAPALNLNTRGQWKHEDNTLTIIPQPEDLQAKVDSIAYQVSEGKPTINYYFQGELLASVEENQLKAVEKPVIFQVASLTAKELILEGNGMRMHFEEDLPALQFQESFGIKSVLRGLLGLMLLVGIAWLFSGNRKAIKWSVVAKGLGIQIILAIGILKVPFVQSIFEGISSFFVVILDFTMAGSVFLLGGLMDVSSYGFIFAFQVLPTIIFFSALTSVLFYLGIIQKIVYGLAWLMVKAMRLSGTESLSVAGNIFLGQTESPLLIKAYLPNMNRSEILLVMIGGMATIAGGVLAAYISFLGGDDPVQRLYFAKHLLAASIMAAPGAIVVSKILMPQTEDISNTIEITKDKIGSNLLEAIANGTGEGLKLAANVAAMLLVFVAMVAMVNYILGDFIGSVTGLNAMIADLTNGQYQALSLQFMLGYVFAPLVYSLGVSAQDMAYVGQLLGEKITMSEFIAYISLADMKDSAAFASEKSIVMATYMLCGFANFASIGIQIGGIGSLAPNQRTLLSQFGIKALIGGTIASLFSATVVGMLF